MTILMIAQAEIFETDEEEGEDEYEDEWGELEYYEDDEGNWVIATSSRMLQHKAILENKALEEVKQQVEDIKKMILKKDDGESGSYSGSSGSWTDSASEGSLESVSDLEEDLADQEEKSKKKQSDGFGDFDDDFDDQFGFDDDGNV